jgi:hypothetical protein
LKTTPQPQNTKHKIQKILLDTNCFWNRDFYYELTISMEALIKYAKENKIELLLPEVCLEEHLQHYTRDNPRGDWKKFKEFFLRKLNRPTLIPVALADPRRVLQKCLQYKKPFKGPIKGRVNETGMKDALLWESFVAYLKRQRPTEHQQHFLFLTANSSDFAGSSKKLHNDLLLDLPPNLTLEICGLQEFFISTIQGEFKEVEAPELKEILWSDNLDERLNALIEAKEYRETEPQKISVIEETVSLCFPKLRINSVSRPLWIESEVLSSRAFEETDHKMAFVQLEVYYKVHSVDLLLSNAQACRKILDLNGREWKANLNGEEQTAHLECGFDLKAQVGLEQHRETKKWKSELFKVTEFNLLAS